LKGGSLSGGLSLKTTTTRKEIPLLEKTKTGNRGKR